MTAPSIDARAIQRALVLKGYPVKVDGIIGLLTLEAIEAAVKREIGAVTHWPKDWLIAFEQIILRDGGLDPGPIDGVMGPRTRRQIAELACRQEDAPAVPPTLPLAFSGPARRLSTGDIAAAAKSLGCEVAALRAVLSIESRGSGFDARNRPIILFEPHVFYRQLAKLPKSTYDRCLNRAVLAGLAYKSWRKGNYPKGSALQQSDGNYDRLSSAVAIHEECAFRAISIGMGQVLGENFKVAGHASAVEMFEAAKQSEAAQLAHMIGFIKENRLDDDIRARRWETFARGYNGPGQVVMYADRLAASYNSWSRIA